MLYLKICDALLCGDWSIRDSNRAALKKKKAGHQSRTSDPQQWKENSFQQPHNIYNKTS